MFKIERQPFGSYIILKLLNESTGEFVSVNPAFGGALHQIGLRKNKEVVEILDTYASGEEVITEFPDTYRGAKLFPFPNMTNKGQYTFEGKSYRLPCNWKEDGHAIHGFVADKPFKIVNENISEDQVSIKISFQYNGDHQGYPFPFELLMIFTLNRNSEFICTTRVRNSGKTNMPVGDGWHPYFNLSSAIDDLYIKMPSDTIIDIDEKFIPTGNITITKEFIDFTQIKSRHFDTCFQLEDRPKSVTQLLCKQKDITISIWQETGKGKYNYQVLYTPPGRKSIAIEPMTCPPDVFNNHKDLIVLRPSAITEVSFGIKLS